MLELKVKVPFQHTLQLCRVCLITTLQLHDVSLNAQCSRSSLPTSTSSKARTWNHHTIPHNVLLTTIRCWSYAINPTGPAGLLFCSHTVTTLLSNYMSFVMETAQLCQPTCSRCSSRLWTAEHSASLNTFCRYAQPRYSAGTFKCLTLHLREKQLASRWKGFQLQCHDVVFLLISYVDVYSHFPSNAPC